MSEKWTKGPWFIHPHGPRYAVNQKGTNRHVAMVSCYMSTATDKQENEANAHIVAAAPDLYVALKGIYDMLYVASDGERIWTMEMQQSARYALAKARGEK